MYKINFHQKQILPALVQQEEEDNLNKKNLSSWLQTTAQSAPESCCLNEINIWRYTWLLK
mgnify:CR=1 FL=1